MNKAITDGFELMPPPFAAGLEVWSRGDGTPGTPCWAGLPEARLVQGDAAFGTCLEIRKTDPVTRLRYTGETPVLPGCYLRISARVKVLSGPLPNVRIGGWAGSTGGVAVPGLATSGLVTEIDACGAVVDISAIVGSGTRGGVTMAWGCAPLYGHFGLDFGGATGAVIRIDALRIEDVTSLYLRKMMDWVDVRDFGARGDGVCDDSAAFRAADAAAKGRRVLVPEGVFRLAGDVSLRAETRFQGRLSMPEDACLFLARGFDLDTYCAAFGDPELALRKALQAFLRSPEHRALDLCGRRVALSAPLDMRALAGGEIPVGRRVLRNGVLDCLPGPGWTTAVAMAAATHDPAAPLDLRVGDTAGLEPGSLVEGAGLGREVYVRAVAPETGRVTLSQPPYAAEPRQSYAFRRFRYALDFGGFAQVSEFTVQNIDLRLNGVASGLLLAPEGAGFAVEGCDITRPRDRALSSPGCGCTGMRIERCQLLSAEVDREASERRSVAINLNGDNARIRDNRAVRFGHFLVAQGTGHVIAGNTVLQGDGSAAGQHGAGIVLTRAQAAMRITDNRLDDCGLDWTGEHDSAAAGFAGLVLTGNSFAVQSPAPGFRFLRVVPHRAGLGLSGLSVTGNLFTASGRGIDRIEGVDNAFAALDPAQVSGVSFEGNIFEGVRQVTTSQVTLSVRQETAAMDWPLDPGAALPFGVAVGTVLGIVAIGSVTTPDGAPLVGLPGVRVEGPAARLCWSAPCRGAVQVILRADRPS